MTSQVTEIDTILATVTVPFNNDQGIKLEAIGDGMEGSGTD